MYYVYVTHTIILFIL